MPMSYTQHGAPSNTELVNRYNQLLLAEFKSRDYSHDKLAVQEPGFITGVKYGHTNYQKATHVLQPLQGVGDEDVGDKTLNNNTIDIITRDGEYHSFVWHTTASNISAAVRYAFPHASSLVGEVNATLGQYHLDAFEDINQGFINHRYFIKKSLLELYQARLAALAKIESLVNSQATKKQINLALQEYSQEIADLEAGNSPASKLGSLRSDLNADGVSDEICYIPVVNGLMQEKERIAAFGSVVENTSVADLTRATGGDSILSFVRQQMYCALNELASLNQDLTFTREFGLSKVALNRGRLHNWILRAKQVVARDHKIDYHNRVRASHHGQFAYYTENDRVLFDSSQYALTADQQQRLLLAISFIEDMNVIDRSDVNNPKVRNNTNPQGVSLTTVASTARAIGKEPVVRALRWVGFFVRRSFFNVLGVVLAVFTQPLRWVGWTDPSQFFDEQATVGTMPLSPVALDGIRIRQSAHQARSLRAYIGDMVYGVGDRLLDTLKGVAELVTLPLTGILHDVRNDYIDGLGDCPPLTDILETVQNEFTVIKANKQARLKALELEWRDSPIEKKLFPEIVAVPEYALSDGDWNLVWNVLTDAGSHFVGSALQTLVVEDPRKGAVLALAVTAAVVNITSLMTPEVSKTLLQLAQNATQSITATIAENTASGAWPIVGGVVSVQLSAVLLELARAQNTPGFDTLWQEKNNQLKETAISLLSTPLQPHAEEVVKDVAPIVREYLLGLNKEISQFGGLRKIYDDFRAKVNALGDESVILSRDLLPLMDFFFTHRANLPYLSEKTKHQLMQHIEKYFDYTQAASLKQCLYPKKQHGTLRATLNMVSAYVQLGIRVPVSIVSSLLVGSHKPFASACFDLFMQIAKDVTSFYRVVQQVVKLVERVTHAVIGLVSDVVVNVVFARLQALIFNTYSISAGAKVATTFFDRAREKIRQFISMPGDYVTKKVTVPDFIDTRSKVGQSYFVMCVQLAAVQKACKKVQTEESMFSTTVMEEFSDSNDGQDLPPSSAIEESKSEAKNVVAQRGAFEASVSPDYGTYRGRMYSASADTIDNRKVESLPVILMQ